MNFLWTPYLKHYPAFTFEFSLMINKENFKRKILAFDEVLLHSGLKYRICLFDKLQRKDLIVEYLNSRKNKFSKDDDENYLLRLYDLQQWGKYDGDMQISTEVFGETYLKSNNMLSGSNNAPILSFHRNDGLFKEDLCEYDFEDHIIYFGITSDSNIWWEELSVTIENRRLERNLKAFDPPLDNRLWAYQITPRFNSFLRDLKNITEKLGGRLLLEEYNKGSK